MNIKVKQSLYGGITCLITAVLGHLILGIIFIFKVDILDSIFSIIPFVGIWLMLIYSIWRKSIWFALAYAISMPFVIAGAVFQLFQSFGDL